MYILGVSCWYHDAAAALIKDGKIVAASEEERFSRKKHDFDFPINSINFCLEKAGINPPDIDYVVFYDKPLVKFDRILISILRNVPRSAGVFREAVPLWLKDKLKFRKKVKKTLKLKEDRVLFCTHHMAHAASSYHLCPFEESAILTVDGVGEWATATLGYGKGSSIKIIKEMHFPHSLGLLYSAFTAYLGFKVNNGEYKVMGMSPYGKPLYKDKVNKVVKVNDDGSIELDLSYFSFEYSTEHTYNKKFIELFGPQREKESLFFTKDSGFPAYYGEKPADFDALAEKNQYYADIAASVQEILEEILIKMARHLKSMTKSDNLCYSGGVALNSKANYRLVKEGVFGSIYMQPAATDAGGAVGAALWCWCDVLGNSRAQVMEHAYWGKEFTEKEMTDALEEKGLKYSKLSDEEIYDRVTDLIIEGKVIGWYQGRTEWGPRALGNRSIIADPRRADMKDKVNKIIKFREPFRPFAPSVLKEDAGMYVERGREIYPDRFMLVTYPVKEDRKKDIPAVTHVNGTSRIQSVYEEYNPRYYRLIKRFKEKTGVGLVLNTSFNLRGEPIVNSPRDAIKTFQNSGMDVLVLGNLLTEKG
ncbi:MAG: carbamoyltransferase [Elusimicrobia bacterium]|nr:carbamoyltransferase [Elusimicrobiota bacterium]